jgi:hypothetical protein
VDRVACRCGALWLCRRAGRMAAVWNRGARLGVVVDPPDRPSAAPRRSAGGLRSVWCASPRGCVALRGDVSAVDDRNGRAGRSINRSLSGAGPSLASRR